MKNILGDVVLKNIIIDLSELADKGNQNYTHKL